MMSQVPYHTDHILQMQRIAKCLNIITLCIPEIESNNMIGQICKWNLAENDEHWKISK